MTNEDYTFRPTAIVDPNPTSFLFLRENTEEVIRLDKEGFHYKGEFIADAGEAHRLMVAFLKQNTAQPEPQGPTDEELLHIARFAIEPYADCGIAVGEYEVETECAIETYGSELIAFARAVLARWGK
jgi:hypothetical protein